jgi:hypothetical protein
MIEFKITTCTDKSQQATYQHVGTLLTIGRTEGDMLVDDPGFGPAQLRIRLENGAATVENLNQAVNLRLNGKPTSGIVPLKEKDNLAVARTSFHFTKVNSSPLSVPERYENPACRDRFSAGTKESALMDALAFLENAAKAAPPPAPATPKPPPLPGATPPKPPLPPLPPRRT